MEQSNPPYMYRYKSLLPGKHIRLLFLYPTEDFQASITCSLLQLSLDNFNPNLYPYEALSYTWGVRNREHEVICDGHKIFVTRNCHTALKYLRLPSQTRILWVDAICINQLSISERNHQVKLMGDVYKLARKVLIWPGEGDQTSARSLRQVHLTEVRCKFLDQNFPSQLARIFTKACRSKLRPSSYTSTPQS